VITYLDDVLDPSELATMLDEGYIQVRHHPDYPYAIYCYTKKAMFDRVWNNSTMTCRGLIINEETGEVLARPFKKFFNYGEPNAAMFSPFDWVTVYDKVDGSLGIAYETPEGPAIATKGSFTSEQAQHATELLRANYGLYQTDDYCTDLFEIIYPENRIVLDYGEIDELRYLGSVVVHSGDNYWNGLLIGHYGIPKNHFLDSGPFYQLELDLNRPNAEGFVLLNDDTGDRLKMKQEDYLELHKVMTGLNERQLWEWLSEGKHQTEIVAELPEEMHNWANEIIDKITDEFFDLTNRIGNAFLYHSKHAVDRKDFAERIAGYPAVDKGALFCMLDGQFDRADQIVWKAVRP